MANGAFSKARDVYEMQKKARALQKELKETVIEAESADGGISVTFNGEQRMIDVKISEAWLKPERKRELEKQLLNVVGQAISKAQAEAAAQMKKIAGDLGLPAGLGL